MTSAVPSRTVPRTPGCARVSGMRFFLTATEGLWLSDHHGSPSESRLLRSTVGLTHGGFPTWRSKPPRAKTVAKSSSQWKKPWASATSRTTVSHSCSSMTDCTLRAPARPSSTSSMVSSSAQEEASTRVPSVPLASLTCLPSSPSKVLSHSSRLGGVTSVVSGQNHSAHHASMTSRSLRYAEPGAAR